MTGLVNHATAERLVNHALADPEEMCIRDSRGGAPFRRRQVCLPGGRGERPTCVQFGRAVVFRVVGRIGEDGPLRIAHTCLLYTSRCV